MNMAVCIQCTRLTGHRWGLNSYRQWLGGEVRCHCPGEHGGTSSMTTVLTYDVPEDCRYPVEHTVMGSKITRYDWYMGLFAGVFLFPMLLMLLCLCLFALVIGPLAWLRMRLYDMRG